MPPGDVPTCGPLLIFSPRLGPLENAGVTQHFRPPLAPREGKGEVATSDFVPLCRVVLKEPDFFVKVRLGTRNSRFVVWPLELRLGTLNPRFVVWPLELGLGTLNPRFVVWPLELGLGTRNPHFVVWPLGLGLGTRNPRLAFLPSFGPLRRQG